MCVLNVNFRINRVVCLLVVIFWEWVVEIFIGEVIWFILVDEWEMLEDFFVVLWFEEELDVIFMVIIIFYVEDVGFY